jgi:hypothetical protein
VPQDGLGMRLGGHKKFENNRHSMIWKLGWENIRKPKLKVY